MKTDLLKQFRLVTSKKTVNFERKLITFFIFLIISVTIWLFSVLHKEYTTDFFVPVEIVNLSNDLIPVSADEKNVLVKIRASGFRLLQFLYAQKDFCLKMDARKMVNEKSIRNKVIRLGESSWYFIDVFKKNFGNDVQIISVMPDSFIVEYTIAYSKMIPVKHNVEYQIPRQYIQITEPVVFPDSVLVTGPKTIIDTMKYCYTEMYSAGTLLSDTSFSLKIDLPFNYRVNPEKVNLKFNIDRYSDKTFSIKPILLNVPEGTEVIIIPEKVDVRVSVALSYFNTISESNITLYADFSKLSEKNDNLLLELHKLPEGVFNPVIYPPQIEFLIKK